ncbi:MAG: hypothetical protein WDO73_25535 [Ignavibacteriota bacterium]
MIINSAALCLAAMLFQAGASSAEKPIIDNERAIIWDTSAPRAFSRDFVAISLPDGKAVFEPKGSTSPSAAAPS